MQMQMIWLPIRRKTIHQHMYIIIMKILMNIRKRCKEKESASKYAASEYKEPTELEIYNKFRINISSYQDYLDNADTEYILE